MASWAEFDTSAPRLADEGERLFYQFGVELVLPSFRDATIVVSTRMDRKGPLDAATLRLRGHEGCVVGLSDGARDHEQDKPSHEPRDP